MDYKKKYKEALERMKSWARGEHPECFSEAQKAAEFIFPELKESEDERIRKALVRFHKSTIDVDGIKGEDIIAWLEKQGEQKPTKNIVEIWKDMRLEVYQQASGNRHESNYSDDTTKMFSLNDIDEIIEKMKEAGYEWDDDKKELKKIEQMPQRTVSAEAKEAMYDKPAWSEDDENMLNLTLGLLSYHRQCRNWLKSLKKRYVWKPSDEQIEILDMVLSNESMDDNVARILRELREQLKKLR